MQLIPRLVAFDENGKAIVAGVAAHLYPGGRSKVIALPTDHYDFLGPVKVAGKTEAEIAAEVATL